MSGCAQYNERELLRAETACRSGFAGVFSSEPADSVLPLPLCFLASTTGAFGFAAAGAFCLPVVSPADSVLPLPLCFLASTVGFFGFAAGGAFCLPVVSLALVDTALPLPSCFLASAAGVFGFDAGSGFCLPVVSPAWADSVRSEERRGG